MSNWIGYALFKEEFALKYFKRKFHWHFFSKKLYQKILIFSNFFQNRKKLSFLHPNEFKITILIEIFPQFFLESHEFFKSFGALGAGNLEIWVPPNPIFFGVGVPLLVEVSPKLPLIYMFLQFNENFYEKAAVI